jgi:hypothetical protein
MEKVVLDFQSLKTKFMWLAKVFCTWNQQSLLMSFDFEGPKKSDASMGLSIALPYFSYCLYRNNSWKL